MDPTLWGQYPHSNKTDWSYLELQDIPQCLTCVWDTGRAMVVLHAMSVSALRHHLISVQLWRDGESKCLVRILRIWAVKSLQLSCWPISEGIDSGQDFAALYCATPRLAKFVVIWNDIERDIPKAVLMSNQCQIPLEFIRETENKIITRFKPRPQIETDCELLYWYLHHSHTLMQYTPFHACVGVFILDDDRWITDLTAWPHFRFQRLVRVLCIYIWSMCIWSKSILSLTIL